MPVLNTADDLRLGSTQASKAYLGSTQVWSAGIGDTLVGPTTITTSTASTATAYSNQRKVDRCQNGVLWASFFPFAADERPTFRYSTDDGATWTDPGAGSSFQMSASTWTYTPNFSFFIDLDDYAHVAYKDCADGYIYYRRGTPNAGRTAWTWSSATALTSVTYYDYPDIVAHREGTGWTAHVVMSYMQSGVTDLPVHRRVDITSGGVITAGTQTNLGATYGNTVHKYPSIDFNHTGDGKTVAGSTPHLYVAWSAGASGAGYGIRFKKATYSGGTWTWGTEREIDSTRYVDNFLKWLNCIFDGTRVVIAGYLAEGGNEDLVLHERDAADTATITRTLLDNATVATSAYTGSATYDGDGNVYLLGRYVSSGTRLGYRKWVRSSGTLDPFVSVDATVDNPYVSAKRGYSNNRIEFIYTDGTSSPYNVVYGGIE